MLSKEVQIQNSKAPARHSIKEQDQRTVSNPHPQSPEAIGDVEASPHTACRQRRPSAELPLSVSLQFLVKTTI